jgi:hypothetical protein
MTDGFTSEDDLNTFEGWLRYQRVDPDTPKEQLSLWRSMYEEAIQNRSPALGLMKPRSLPGEYLYAVAVRDRGLWLVLWVRRSADEVFAMMPRGDRKADIHASYHRDGKVHMKANGRKAVVWKLQPLDNAFRGTEHLGTFGGFGPKKVGAVCEPTAFHDILELPTGLLGPRDGRVIVDLVEPNCQPISWPDVVLEMTFRDVVPWTVIRVAK